MKHIITLIFLLGFLLPLCSRVQIAAENRFGYTNENIDASNNFRLGSSKSQGLAIRISHEKLQMFRGKTISQIRAVMGSKNSTNNEAKLFITSALDATPIVSQSVTISEANTWVEYPLETPYTITGNEDELYIGFTLEISTAYGPFSADHSADSKGLCFARNTNGWQDLYGKGYGMANIEMVLAGDCNFTDIMVKSFEKEGYLKVNKPEDYAVELVNLGTTTLKNFDINVYFNNEMGEMIAEGSITSHKDVEIGPHGTFSVPLSAIASSESGLQKMCVSITNLEDNEGVLNDDECSDNIATTDLCFYPEDMKKKVLVEAFTGVTCSNCPSGHYAMETAIANTGVPAVEVSHHSGFVEDRFSMQEDWDILSLYDSSTYAPAATVNRSKLGKNSSPVFDPQSISGTSTILELANETQPYISIAIDTDYNTETKVVNLKAHFYPYNTMPGNELHYTIYLVQDGIVSYQSNGGSDYVHNSVNRGCITEGSWGEAVEFIPGELLTIEKSFVLEDAIVSSYYTKNIEQATIPTVLENMRLVVFVHQYSARDVNSNKVFNCEEVKIGECTDFNGFPVGIETVHAESTTTAPHIAIVDGKLVIDSACENIAVYTLSGKRANPELMSHGVYLVRYKSHGKSFTQKLAI